VRRTPLLVFGIAVVGPVILAACSGGGSGDTPSPTPTVVSTATPTATPTPAQSAEATATPTPSPTPTPVLSPCEAVPDLPATVSDPENLYTISIPEGWIVVNEEGPRGLRLSSISLESPDFSVFVDEVEEGPFSPIYYETGATLVIFAGTMEEEPPYHFGGVISEGDVTIDGEVVPYHVFLEPSTWAGQLLDAHLNHGGNGYTFDLAYNPETCPAGEDLFRAMLDSFLFN